MNKPAPAFSGVPYIPLTAPVIPGRIARPKAIFYMHVEYELELKGMLPMLKRWNAADPPNAVERE
jgi:endonuclease I